MLYITNNISWFYGSQTKSSKLPLAMVILRKGHKTIHSPVLLRFVLLASTLPSIFGSLGIVNRSHLGSRLVLGMVTGVTWHVWYTSPVQIFWYTFLVQIFWYSVWYSSVVQWPSRSSTVLWFRFSVQISGTVVWYSSMVQWSSKMVW